MDKTFTENLLSNLNEAQAALQKAARPGISPSFIQRLLDLQYEMEAISDDAREAFQEME